MLQVQDVRLMDVFLLGPFMVWFGAQATGPSWARYAMMVAGLMTAAYNWQRYQEGVA